MYCIFCQCYFLNNRCLRLEAIILCEPLTLHLPTTTLTDKVIELKPIPLFLFITYDQSGKNMSDAPAPYTYAICAKPFSLLTMIDFSSFYSL